MQRRWISVVGFTAVLAGAGLGLAVSGPFGTPPRLLAYGGTLEQNGVALNGDVPMTFFILDSPSAPVASALWSEDYPAADPVQVVGGRFQVQLGSRTPNTGIPDTVMRTGELYVAVRVAGVDLAGRQRLLTSPYAITAAQAQDFTVRGNLQVAGALNIAAGALTDGTVTGADLASNSILSSHLTNSVLVLEAESTSTNSYFGPTTAPLGTAARRICFVSQWTEEGPDNCMKGCAVEVVAGNWQVRASGSTCAGGIGQATCFGRCLAW